MNEEEEEVKKYKERERKSRGWWGARKEKKDEAEREMKRRKTDKTKNCWKLYIYVPLIIFKDQLANKWQKKFITIVPTPLSAGGVGMYIDDTFNYKVLEKCSNESFQAFLDRYHFT